MVHTTDDGLSVSKIEEGSVEEVLASFRTPNEPELDRFLQYYGLGDNNLVIMDTTTSQSVIDAMAQSVKFFENP